MASHNVARDTRSPQRSYRSPGTRMFSLLWLPSRKAKVGGSPCPYARRRTEYLQQLWCSVSIGNCNKALKADLSVPNDSAPRSTAHTLSVTIGVRRNKANSKSPSVKGTSDCRRPPSLYVCLYNCTSYCITGPQTRQRAWISDWRGCAHIICIVPTLIYMNPNVQAGAGE